MFLFLINNTKNKFFSCLICILKKIIEFFRHIRFVSIVSLKNKKNLTLFLTNKIDRRIFRSC